MADLDDANQGQRALDASQAQAPQQKPAGKVPHASTGACDACRARKVRCLANESSMSSKCQRCARAGRECVYTVHSKTRRRKRTDTRVKELEEKVKSLSLLLEQNKGESRSEVRRGSGQSPETEDDAVGDEDEEWSDDGEEADLQENETIAGSSRQDFDGYVAFKTSGLGPAVDDGPSKNRTHFPTQVSSANKFTPTGSISPDVIERGLITVEKAQEIFDRYMNVLSPNYPALYFPPGTSAIVMREERPVLFLAVLAAGAGNQEPTLNLALNQEILQVYANKVAVHGEKSLELVMSILISTLWYYPPDKFEELKFHQYIHMAATMALDIGLGKRPRMTHANEDTSRTPLMPEVKSVEIGSRSVAFSAKSYPNSATLESRRTLLACYLACSSVSMSLRLPNMLRFTSWMNDCLNVLDTSPDAAPGDKRLVAWIRIQRLIEECVITFSLDDPGSTASLSDNRVQQMLKSYERQLDDLMKSMKATPGVFDGFLEINFHINNIFIHEIALHPEYDSEDFRPPFFVAATSSKIKTPLGPAYVHAITECVTSAQTAIKVFLHMNIDRIRALPALLYVRIIYCSIILIKLDVSANSPESEIGKILDRYSLMARGHIERALIQMKIVAGNDNKNILAAKFCMILGKLVLWYRQTMKPGASGEEQPSLFSATRSFIPTNKPNETPSNPTYPTSVPAEPAPSGSTLKATTVPPLPLFDGSFTSLNSFSGAPQYPTPGHSPFPAQQPILPTNITTPEMSHMSTTYSEGTPQSNDYASPELIDRFGQQYAIPMDVDPSMFNQLQGADPYTFNPDPNEWLLYEGMEYPGVANMPDFDWQSIPGPR